MALRDARDDVARIFEALVAVLASQAPDRLTRAIQVSELYQRILPYRRYRAHLGIDSNQDYEMALLRMLAGERGYASVQPPEAQAALAEEAAAVSPDPSLVREFAGATVTLDRVKVNQVLAGDQQYAPPEEPRPAVTPAATPFALEPAPPEEPEAPAAIAAPASAPQQSALCRNCGRTLPLHRDVVYCPFCGQVAGRRTCPGCGEQLEDGWRFCVTCGQPRGGER